MAVSAGVNELVEWASLAIMLLSSLTVVALFVLRRRDPDGGTFRCPGYPVVPVVYLLTCLGVAVSATLYNPRRALLGVALVALGFPLYWLARRFINALDPARDGK